MPFLIGIFAIIVMPCVAVVIWLLVIRPYCRRNGRGYTAGANAGVTFWVDWQDAKEIAQRRNDKRMMAVCHALLLIQITAGLALLGAMVFSNP